MKIVYLLDIQGYFDNPNIDIFNSIPQLFVKVSELINELFDQPEKVTERLIITVYMEKLAVRHHSPLKALSFHTIFVSALCS